MADCYLRKEIGSNVFKKMKDPAESRYFNIMSNYYDTAWKYGIGQNANKSKTYTKKGGAAASGIKLPEDFQEQNKGSMDKLREQMGTGKAMTYISNIANIDKQLKENISSDKAKELKEEKDMNVRALYTLGQTQAGRTEIIGDLTSVFQDREKAVSYFEGIIQNAGSSPTTGVPYASTKTENADVYIVLKGWLNTPYLVDNAKDKAIIDSYINRIENGHPILDKDFPELQTLIATYNTPEKLANAKENEFYAGKKNDLYNMLKGENNGLTPSQTNYYWTIYNNIDKGYALEENQRDAMDKLYPEFRTGVAEMDSRLTEALKEINEKGGGGAGAPPQREGLPNIYNYLDNDKVLGQGLFASIMAVWNKEAPAIAPSAGQAIQDAGMFTPKTVGPITYNPITGMAGLSFLPDIPAMVISPITKSLFGYDAVTGDTTKPTVGDWVSTLLTFTGAAEARGINVFGTAKGAVSDFLSSNLGRFPGGKSAAGAVDDVIKQAPKVADDAAAVTKDSINKAFLNDVDKVKHTWEQIGPKNYQVYVTDSGKKFASMEDAVSFFSAKRDIALSSLDDITKESSKINSYINNSKTVADKVFKEGVKYGDDAAKSMTDEFYAALDKAGLVKYPEAPATLADKAIGVATTVGKVAGITAITAATGVALFPQLAWGMIVWGEGDSIMNPELFQVGNVLGGANPAMAAGSLYNLQNTYKNELIPTKEIMDTYRSGFLGLPYPTTPLLDLLNIPWDKQINTFVVNYTELGGQNAKTVGSRGYWTGDFFSGKPATYEDYIRFHDNLQKNPAEFKAVYPRGKEDYNYLRDSQYFGKKDKYNEDISIATVGKDGTIIKVNPATGDITPTTGSTSKDDKDSKSPKGQGLMTGLGVNQIAPGIAGKSVSDRINTLLGDKTLDKFQIRTLGETFKIPGVDQLNNLLNSDKLQEAKAYLSQKLSEVVPGYKPYEKSAWQTPGSNYKPDRSGICLSACQAACQSAQTGRGTGSGGGGAGPITSQSYLGCGGGEAHGGGECREYGCDAVAESRAILCGEGTTCGSKQVVGCAACESAAEALQALRCSEGSTPQPSCGYDLSGYNVGCNSEAGGLPTEDKGSQGGSVPMEYCSGGEICSQGESCDSSDISAAEASCSGCETVWQMGCMSKELGMRKKK